MDKDLMHDIEILAIIWLSVFLASILSEKTRLTPVLWYLFFGSLLTNIGLLPIEMPTFITGFAELGIITIMFSLGFEEETSNFLSSIKRSWGIAFFGAIAPFSIAYSFSLWLWDNFHIALLCGLAMTSTTVSLTMASLKTEGLNKSPAATGIMTSAVLDNIASLALLATLMPIATAQASLKIDDILLIAAKATLFFLFVSFIGAILFPISKGWIKNIPIIGQFSLQQVLTNKRGKHTMLALLLIAVLVALLAHYFGLHPAIGAYIAGLIIRKEYFDQSASDHTTPKDIHFEQTLKMVDNIAFSWIGPVFFVVLGNKLLFDGDIILQVLPYALILFIGLFVGQILSALLAAKYTGKFSWSESWMIGFGMLGRAELAFVVMDIAYVQTQLISVNAFYTLMITCFLLNISVPLTIRWWKAYFQTSVKTRAY